MREGVSRHQCGRSWVVHGKKLRKKPAPWQSRDDFEHGFRWLLGQPWSLKYYLTGWTWTLSGFRVGGRLGVGSMRLRGFWITVAHFAVRKDSHLLKHGLSRDIPT